MAASIGDTSVAAHQIAFQLFIFLALVLDALAIAGQVIVGRTLGAEDVDVCALRRPALGRHRRGLTLPEVVQSLPQRFGAVRTCRTVRSWIAIAPQPAWA